MNIINKLIILLLSISYVNSLELINLRHMGGCRGTRYGCCTDGVSPARSLDDYCKFFGGCRGTRYGCCTDGVTPAHSWDDDCRLFGSCKSTEFGCCTDGVTPAHSLDDNCKNIIYGGNYSKPLSGNYCYSFPGGNLELVFFNNSRKSNVNISLSVWGMNINCNYEQYLLSDNFLHFSNNTNDCLNKQLNSYGQCPCPPVVYYNNKVNHLEVRNLSVGSGSLILTVC